METLFNGVFLLLCLVSDGSLQWSETNRPQDRPLITSNIHNKMFLRPFVCQQTHKIHRGHLNTAGKTLISVHYLLTLTHEVKCTVYFMLSVQLKEQFTQNRHWPIYYSPLFWLWLWWHFLIHIRVREFHRRKEFPPIGACRWLQHKNKTKKIQLRENITCLRTACVMPKCPEDSAVQTDTKQRCRHGVSEQIYPL